VRETLQFTALLVLGHSRGRAGALARAEELLRELGLAAAAETFVGNWYLRGVSGERAPAGAGARPRLPLRVAE
jgi:hypothetical protein